VRDGHPRLAVHDVRDETRPHSCESITGIEQPELGLFASDTVGWGLALAAFGLSVGAAVVTAKRIAARSGGG
jgi:hypothetical protein